MSTNEVVERLGCLPTFYDNEREQFLGITLELRDAIIEALSTRPLQVPETPFGYAYRYPEPFGRGTVIRYNHGEEANGSKPLEAIALYTADQLTAMSQKAAPAAASEEALREIAASNVPVGSRYNERLAREYERIKRIACTALAAPPQKAAE